jgi:hypothetical protein
VSVAQQQSCGAVADIKQRRRPSPPHHYAAMSPPDFAAMDRMALRAFRENAVKHNEKPTVENNYFTTKPKEERCPQPSDWIPTCVAMEWCEYHGPCQHKPDECSIVAAGSLNAAKKTEPKKKAQKPKLTMRRYYEKVRIRPFCLSFNPIRY